MFAEESFKPAPPWICLLEGILVAWNDQETPRLLFFFTGISLGYDLVVYRVDIDKMICYTMIWYNLIEECDMDEFV